MADIAPSASVTKFGSLLLVFAVAVLAIWAVNNFAALQRITAKKTAA